MARPNEVDDKTAKQILEEDDDEADEGSNFLASSAIGTTTQPVMGTDDTRRQEKRESKQKSQESNIFFQHATTAAHAAVLLYVMLIIYYCLSGEFQFFTWHPLLMSLGWMFLMTEAILTMSKDNLLTGTLPKKLRVRLHWIFQAVGMTFIAIAFVVVVINKNNLNKSHFKTWHALLGFIGIVCTVPATLDGVAALFHSDLRHYIRPRINKFVHILNGTVAYAFGGLALLLSVYTNWFAKHSNGNVLIFALALIFVVTAVAWTLVRPVIACYRQLKQLK